MTNPEDIDILKSTGILRRLTPCRDCPHGPNMELGDRLCGAFFWIAMQNCNAEWEWEMLPAGGLTGERVGV